MTFHRLAPLVLVAAAGIAITSLGCRRSHSKHPSAAKCYDSKTGPAVEMSDADASKIEPQLAQCVHTANARQPIPKTTVDLRLLVSREGAATCVQVVLEPFRPDLESCIRDAVRAVKLEPRKRDERQIIGAWILGPQPDAQQLGDPAGRPPNRMRRR